MSTNDLNMDVETQRRIEYTRQKLMRIEQMNEQFKKLTKANQASEEKLERLIQRKDSLESDIQRLTDVSMGVEQEMGSELLGYLENPMDMEMLCAEEMHSKMSQLKVLLIDIIVRTCFNEKAMCMEIGHQEVEFEMRLNEAMQTRKHFMNKNHNLQKNCEDLIAEQAKLYEIVDQLTENIQKFDASRWLLNVEKRRVSDLLDKTHREPSIELPQQRKRENVGTALIASSEEQILTSSASLSHSHSSIEPENGVLLGREKLMIPPQFKIDVPKVTKPDLKQISSSDVLNEDSMIKRTFHAMSENRKIIFSQNTEKSQNSLGNFEPIQKSESIASNTSNKRKISKLGDGNMNRTLPLGGVNLMNLIKNALDDEFGRK